MTIPRIYLATSARNASGDVVPTEGAAIIVLAFKEVAQVAKTAPGYEEMIDAQLIAANVLAVGTLLRVDKGGTTKDVYRVLRASPSRIGRNNYALTRKIENAPTS